MRTPVLRFDKALVQIFLADDLPDGLDMSSIGVTPEGLTVQDVPLQQDVQSAQRVQLLTNPVVGAIESPTWELFRSCRFFTQLSAPNCLLPGKSWPIFEQAGF